MFFVIACLLFPFGKKKKRKKMDTQKPTDETQLQRRILNKTPVRVFATVITAIQFFLITQMEGTEGSTVIMIYAVTLIMFVWFLWRKSLLTYSPTGWEKE